VAFEISHEGKVEPGLFVLPFNKDSNSRLLFRQAKLIRQVSQCHWALFVTS